MTFEGWGGVGRGGGDLKKKFVHSLCSKKKHWPVRNKNVAQKDSSTPPQKSNGSPQRQILRHDLDVICAQRYLTLGWC